MEKNYRGRDLIFQGRFWEKVKNFFVLLVAFLTEEHYCHFLTLCLTLKDMISRISNIGVGKIEKKFWSLSSVEKYIFFSLYLNELKLILHR